MYSSFVLLIVAIAPFTLGSNHLDVFASNVGAGDLLWDGVDLHQRDDEGQSSCEPGLFLIRQCEIATSSDDLSNKKTRFIVPKYPWFPTTVIFLPFFLKDA